MYRMLQNSIVFTNKETKRKQCHYCQSDLLIDEGTWFFDKKWFHNDCLNNYEKTNDDM